MCFVNHQFALKKALHCCNKLMIFQNHAFQEEIIFSNINRAFDLDFKLSLFYLFKKTKKA